ncbi:unnamed protein product [Rhizoctonia solani]|uniref:Class I glutamine amidotransferase-like protein n=1 Tax=Rhizoctonia solani TaxID=456999 RepID=A0A8H3AZW4_9AGAM|nr:unnamed protein product [Rhizoctonia solani]
MAKHLNLALLICDTPLPAVQAEHGTYLDIFRTHLQKSLKYVLESKGERADSIQFTLDGYDVVHQAYPDELKLETYDGIVLTGSAASAYAPLPWISPLLEFVARVTKTHPRIKILGWEVGVFDVELNQVGEQVFGRKELRIHQMHRDHVPDSHIPSGFEVIGVTPACANQGMILRYPDAKDSVGYEGIHVFTVQGHPEFHESIISKIVDARELSGVLNPSAAADARRRAPLPHDGIPVIGRVMWGILGID